jgi:dihydrofolate reductase
MHDFTVLGDIEPFATFINGAEKFAVTSTTPEETWANSRVVDGGLEDFVTELRQQPGRDIGVQGSIGLTQSLLELGLVDELRLVIAPALQMSGRKLFDKGLPRRLSLTSNITSPPGYLLLGFHVAG